MHLKTRSRKAPRKSWNDGPPELFKSAKNAGTGTAAFGELYGGPGGKGCDQHHFQPGCRPDAGTEFGTGLADLQRCETGRAEYGGVYHHDGRHELQSPRAPRWRHHLPVPAWSRVQI